MRDGALEPWRTWIAKRATVALVVFIAWSWATTNPEWISTAIERTGDAWCAAIGCPSLPASASVGDTDQPDTPGLSLGTNVIVDAAAAIAVATALLTGTGRTEA